MPRRDTFGENKKEIAPCKARAFAWGTVALGIKFPFIVELLILREEGREGVDFTIYHPYG